MSVIVAPGDGHTPGPVAVAVPVLWAVAQAVPIRVMVMPVMAIIQAESLCEQRSGG